MPNLRILSCLRWLFQRRVELVFLCLGLASGIQAFAAAPTILSQPLNVTNIAGVSVVFSASVSGSQPLVYQWQQNGVNLNDHGRYSGATSGMLSISSVLPSDGADYRLLVTNSSGAATSQVATLTVIQPAFLTIPDAELESALRVALKKDLQPLTPADLAQLRSFSACGQNISNLSGLEWATNLTGVSLCFNAITNLTPLEGLNSLEQLSLDGNHITDISALAGLTNLIGLNLGDNSISNTAPISSLTHLKVLSLYKNPLANLNALSTLSSLESLTAFSAGVTDVSPLTALTSLNYLELRWNPLTNAETALANLTNLTTLYLGGTGISNLTFLQNHSQLNFLDVDHTQVSDLSPLAGLPQLRNLDAGYNPLTNLANLTALTNLDNLYASGNAITNVENIAALRQLRGLVLHGNQISDLTSLGTFTNLNKLALSENPITNWTSPDSFTNLTQLWLDGTSVSNLNFFQNMRALEAVSLRSCRQNDLTPVANLTNMVALFADHNTLTNIDALAGLPRLSEAKLTGNLLDLSAGSPALAVVDTLRSRGASVHTVPQNQPPQISIPSEWVIAANKTSTLRFNLSDDLTPGNLLVVTTSSANTNLIPSATVLAPLAADSRVLSVSPISNQLGTATITLTVTDDAGLNTNVVLNINVIAPADVSINDTNLAQAIGLALSTTATNFTAIDLAALTTLNISSSSIRSLDGLQWATNLKALYCTSGNITNLAPLQSLPGLQMLAIRTGSNTDLSPLIGLSNLVSLTLQGDTIGNVEFLTNLTQLIDLSLTTRSVTNFYPVTGLTNLLSLHLSECKPGNLDLLSALPRLTSLGLAGCRATNIAALTSLTNLLTLQLERNRLTDISALTNLTRLTFVDVSYNLFNPTGNAPLQNLLSRGVVVNYQPQRGLPLLVTPGSWLASANATSYLRCSSWDEGGAADEYPTVTVIADTPSLVPGVNLTVAQNLPKFPKDWIVSLTPPVNLATSTALKVIATSELGWKRTNTVTLTLALPLPVDSSVLNDTNLIWQTGGGAPWFGQSQTTHDGVAAARSGSIGDNNESWIQTTITGPRQLSFWWKVSSESTYDWLECYTNSVRLNQKITGEQGWDKMTLNLPAGAQTVRWRYVKDDGYSQGQDAAWLDEVSAKIAASISISNLSQTYDGTAHPISVATDPPGLAVSITYNGASSAPTNAGSYAVNATISDANYYASASNTLTIAKAILTVTADDKLKGTGLPVPPLTMRYAGFAAGDGPSAVNSSPILSTTATNSSPPGNFPISVTGGSSSNYTLVGVTGVLTITNSPLIILSLTGAGTTNAVVTWTSIRNYNYQLQYLPSPGSAWLPVGANIVATGWVAATVDTGIAPQRIYRVVQLGTESASAIFTNPPPQILSLVGGGTTNTMLTWSSVSNVSYRILYASDLNATWFTLTPDVRATSTTASASDKTDGVPRRYYRVLVVP